MCSEFCQIASENPRAVTGFPAHGVITAKCSASELRIVRERSCAKPSGTADSGRWLEVDRVQKKTAERKVEFWLELKAKSEREPFA